MLLNSNKEPKDCAEEFAYKVEEHEEKQLIGLEDPPLLL
jgi:hypothetical protein